MKPFIQRKYLLWDTFQPQFLAMNVAHQGLVFLTLAGSLFMPLMLKLNNTPVTAPEAEDIANRFLVLHESIWPVFPIVLIVIVIHSVFLSHRIAGPLYRFRHVFQAISEGDLTVSTRIRKRDYLQKEAGSLGRMVGGLKAKITTIETDCRALQGLVQELKQELKKEMQQGSVAQASDIVARLELQCDGLAADIQQFTIHDQTHASTR